MARINLNDYTEVVEAIQKDDTIDTTIVEHENGNVEVIPKGELAKYNPNEVRRIIPKPPSNDIVDGSSSSVAMRYLEKEFLQMADFFNSRGVKNPNLDLDLDEPGEWNITVDFPIPLKIKKPDGSYFYRDKSRPTERFLFLINGYPNLPPVGFHVTKDAPDDISEALKVVFDSHIFTRVAISGVSDNARDLLKQKWEWICFHYKDNSWKFNPSQWDTSNKLIPESSLIGYFYYVYYRMMGEFSVSS